MKITLLLYKKLKLIHRSIVKHEIFVKTLKRMFLYMIQILASVILGSKKPRNSKTSKATQALKIFTWLYYTILLKYERNLPEVFTRKRLLRKFIQIALWHEFSSLNLLHIFRTTIEGCAAPFVEHFMALLT